MARVGDKIDLYSGNDDQIVPILSMGGKGVISVLSNLLPGETSEMCKAFFRGDVKKAAEMQCHYFDLINALFSEVNPIPVKEAMRLIGYDCGPCRLPLGPMDAVKKEKLAQLLK
jgi:4-hydroxy-tetrahydrodipicolinate synthase